MLTPLLFCLTVLAADSPAPMRPPAVPLVTHDPYFSIWSTTSLLTDSSTKHWTGTDQPLNGLVRIDGEAYRFLGDQPRALPPLEQVGVELTPTRTIYSFEDAGIRLVLTFLTPALPGDLDILTRPVTYVSFEVRSIDGDTHDVAIEFDASSLISTNTPEQRVTWSRVRLKGMEVLRAGTTDQPVLEKSGDNLRIDWGYLYLAVSESQAAVLQAGYTARTNFVESGRLPEADELEPSERYGVRAPLLSASFDLGKVSNASVSRTLMLAYDDVWSLEYFNRKLRPYWRRNGMDAAGLLKAAAADHDTLLTRSMEFDKALTSDLLSAGGPKYAALAIAAYRQTLAAHKIAADIDGSPICMSKENSSNGSIDTVDVLYPAAPFFLLLNPKLLEAQMIPVLDYASMPRWPWRYAPHDLGRYPLADGQGYGGGEKTERNQMPVEESGNMLILSAAIAKVEGNADMARKYWPLLTKWAEYLSEKGLDPEEQLSTDDFAGHLAHNTNLSLKAILALKSYADLAHQLGHADDANKYDALSKDMAAKWITMADDGDHYRLAFDKAGTWSQKYNLVWDRILGYNLFPPTLTKKEIAYYERKQNLFGLPLDNRATYTKLDWLIWTATLADNQKDFEKLAERGYKFANETPTRVPLSDWYFTTDGKQRGFRARSVVGGIYIKMLADPAIWKKWAAGSGGF
jgi:Domain of unknown function (DUF4965)/Domain of unknown function (DUF5127)/Domain of unknown function (DUF1793)/Domain of unknown function (DUF4964)